MATPTSKRREIIESLSDKAYRDAFVAESIRTGIAFQIRLNREARSWKQKDLGRRADIHQVSISKLENPGREESMTLSTLKKLASAFDVALVIRFVPFSELVNWSVELREERLIANGFTDDEELKQETSNAGDLWTLQTKNRYAWPSEPLSGYTSMGSEFVLLDARSNSTSSFIRHAPAEPPLEKELLDRLELLTVAAKKKDETWPKSRVRNPRR